MAKGATHRVPGSRRWRPDMDKHPRSCIEGWAAATDGQRQSQLAVHAGPRGDGRRHGAGGEGAAKSSGEGCLGIGSESSHSELALFVPVAIL